MFSRSFSSFIRLSSSANGLRLLYGFTACGVGVGRGNFLLQAVLPAAAPLSVWASLLTFNKQSSYVLGPEKKAHVDYHRREYCDHCSRGFVFSYPDLKFLTRFHLGFFLIKNIRSVWPFTIAYTQKAFIFPSSQWPSYFAPLGNSIRIKL